MRAMPNLQLDQALELDHVTQGIVKLSFEYDWG